MNVNLESRRALHCSLVANKQDKYLPLIRSFGCLFVMMSFACGHRSSPLDGESSQSDSTQESGTPNTDDPDQESSPPSNPWPTPDKPDSAENGSSQEKESSNDDSDLPKSFVSNDSYPICLCDTWSQDCPEGEKCVPVITDGSGAWNSNACSPVVASPDAFEEECRLYSVYMGFDSCDYGNFCWKFDRSGNGVCHPFATGSPDDPSCPDGYYFPIYASGVLTICEQMCDPLMQNCRENEVCVFWDIGVFTCVESYGGHPYGSDCDSPYACTAGLVCAPGEAVPGCSTANCCTPFCDLNNPVQCEGLSDKALNCLPFFEEGDGPEGFRHLGFCGVSDESSDTEGSSEGAMP